MKAALLALVLLPLTPLRAVDGDTLDGRVTLRPGLEETVRVRLDCYSAPELRADGGGVAEALALTKWLATGGPLSLATMWRRDKYGRVLGEPCRADGGCFCATAH